MYALRFYYACMLQMLIKWFFRNVVTTPILRRVPFWLGQRGLALCTCTTPWGTPPCPWARTAPPTPGAVRGRGSVMSSSASDPQTTVDPTSPQTVVCMWLESLNRSLRNEDLITLNIAKMFYLLMCFAFITELQSSQYWFTFQYVVIPVIYVQLWKKN